VRRLLEEEDGATMAEYGLLLALIAIVCIAGLRLMGNNVNNTFSTYAGSV
jgi:pilus assembly protein Flp/PilA